MSAILAQRSCSSLADRSSWHTKHRMVSAIPSRIRAVATTETCGIVRQLQYTLIITQKFIAIPLQPTARHGNVIVTVNGSAPRRASLACHFHKAGQRIFRNAIHPLCTLELNTQIVFGFLQHHVSIRAVNGSLCARILFTAVVLVQVVFYRAVRVLHETPQLLLYG